MNYLSIALSPRILGVLLIVLLVLLLLIAFFLGHMHMGGMPTFAQSTESILD